MMTHEQFDVLVSAMERPIILLEGTRDLPEADAGTLIKFATSLASVYCHAIFRTGNAKGSDEAFACGINAVDPARLEYVLPYAGHRRASVGSSSYCIAITEISRVAEERAAYQTSQSSPEYSEMMRKRDTVPAVRSKARYLLRDTLKVIGDHEANLAQATAGIFYVNANNAMKGGTGHTIRVCEKNGVPVVFQKDWMSWQLKGSLTRDSA